MINTQRTELAIEDIFYVFDEQKLIFLLDKSYYSQREQSNKNEIRKEVREFAYTLESVRVKNQNIKEKQLVYIDITDLTYTQIDFQWAAETTIKDILK